MLASCVAAYITAGDIRQAQLLAEEISDPSKKISTLIQTGRLKGAYLVAVQSGMVEEVQRIRSKAQQQGNQGVLKICNLYLQQAARR